MQNTRTIVGIRLEKGEKSRVVIDKLFLELFVKKDKLQK